MSTFTDDWNDHAPRATVTVLENTRSAKVTYSNDTGAKFRVMVHHEAQPYRFWCAASRRQTPEALE